MKIITTILILACVLMTSIANATTAANQEWDNRLLIIYADQVNNNDLQQQLNTEAANAKALNERDLKVITATKAQVDAATNIALKKLFEHYGLLDDKFKLILIGKDGTVKFSATKYTPWTKIINVIDAIPALKQDTKSN